MDHLYVPVFTQLQNKLFSVPIESVIIFFSYKYLEDAKVYLHLILVDNHDKENDFVVNFENTEYDIITLNDLNNIVALCELPSILVQKKTLISGLCSVVRQIIKSTLMFTPEHHAKCLLGFRNACLLACNEVSVWTRFCEIDMVRTTINCCKITDDNLFEIPVDVARFETHLSLPVRIHNIYKIARENRIIKDTDNKDNINTVNVKNERKSKQRKWKSKQKLNNIVESSTPIENLNIHHVFAEGPFMTLADLILFPQMSIIINRLGSSSLRNSIPLTLDWYDLMKQNQRINTNEMVILPSKTLNQNVSFTFPLVKLESLYKADPKRYKPQNRIFTKQEDIDNSLSIIEHLIENISITKELCGSDLNIDWSTLPIDVSPLGGALPESRAQRKSEQLENLAKAIVKLSKPGDRIVDFCSGSGHLGILVAALLPKCNIILLENKEESLKRAENRINHLKLTNITLIQCNLDYFKGCFDIGVSLHACGVATDLVIQQCLKNRACFVSCPCCYGGVHNCHHLTYPRSTAFKQSTLTLHDYYVLGHSADQTHDEGNSKTQQGEKCMNVIDLDRMLQAKECGYEVMLGKLKPPSCTPKNNLLIGWPSESSRI